MHFYPGLLLLKMSHDVAFKFAIGDRGRESKPESHADGVICDKIVEVSFGLVDGPMRNKVVLRKDDIAVSGFDGEIFGVVLLSGREKMSKFLNERMLDGNGVVRCLGNNIRTPDCRIGMNSFFPRELNGSEVVRQTGLLE